MNYSVHFQIWVKSQAKIPLNTCKIRENILNEPYILRNGFGLLQSCVHSYWNVVFHGILPECKKIQNDHIQHKNKVNGNVWGPHTEGENCDKRQFD